MWLRRLLAISVVGGLLAFVLPVQAAFAVGPPTVTLSANATVVPYKGIVRLTGRITPRTGGETVRLTDDGGATNLRSATTDATGAFSFRVRPTANMTLQASWPAQAVLSAPLQIRVRQAVSVGMSGARLFAASTVRGRVVPASPGGKVVVALRLGARRIATRRPSQNAKGEFRTRFSIERPGRFHITATSAASGLAAGIGSSRSYTTRLPRLHAGSRGTFVRSLERRLIALHYHLPGANIVYDPKTADAVMAFRKVQGMARTSTVDAGTWRRLAKPRIPKPVSRRAGFHIEIDQRKQVLYTVQDGAVTNVLHVSTGKPSTPTPDGHFRVYSKLAGYSPHRLYYPSYFDANRAIHGWPDVPSYAASHGCTRVPMWAAIWIYGLAKIGTPVIVHH